MLAEERRWIIVRGKVFVVCRLVNELGGSKGLLVRKYGRWFSFKKTWRDIYVLLEGETYIYHLCLENCILKRDKEKNWNQTFVCYKVVIMDSKHNQKPWKCLIKFLIEQYSIRRIITTNNSG